MEETLKKNIPALIIGGSLGGLTTALSLSRVGISSTILERTTGRTQRGVAIRVAGAPLQNAVGKSTYKTITDLLGGNAVQQGTLPHSWWDVYQALRTAVMKDASIQIIEGAKIVEVGQSGNKPWALSETGERWEADLLIGADGYRSVVRKFVSEEQPHADYAGYIAWLGQAEIPAKYKKRIRGVDFFSGNRELLAVYPLIEKNMELNHFGFGWFDTKHNALMREIGVISNNHVMKTPRSEAIPGEVYHSLIQQAKRLWDEPWRSGVIHAIENREIIATPISEYIPNRVVRENVVLIGDAAHAQSPMTGAGFEEATLDAVALANVLEKEQDIPQALEHYQLLRLSSMRSRVEAGQAFGRSMM
ncbi:MAG: NAD(P)/FAD-dependent oxidoreductase [Niabella sp.]